MLLACIVDHLEVPHGRGIDPAWMQVVEGYWQAWRDHGLASAAEQPQVTTPPLTLTGDEFAATKRLMEGNRATPGEVRA